VDRGVAQRIVRTDLWSRRWWNEKGRGGIRSTFLGHTGDLMERVKRHNNGEVRSTRNRGPFHLIYSEEFNTRSEAMRRERYLKTAEGGLEKRRIIKEIGA